MTLDEDIRKLETFLDAVPDSNSKSFGNFFERKSPDERKKFELDLLHLDMPLGWYSFISFNLGNEREVYNLRASGYDEHSNEEHRRVYLSLVDEFFRGQIGKLVPTLGKVSKLDIGCATGERTLRYDGYVRETGAQLDSFGIDISEKMAKIAAGRGIQVKQASMTAIPFPDKAFNWVTLIFGSISHLDGNQFEKAFREIYRITDNGYFFLDVSTEEVGGSFYTRHTYSTIQNGNLRGQLLQKRLAIKDYLGQKYLTYSGHNTGKVQSVYIFPRDLILSLASKTGFQLVSSGKVTQRQLGYHYDGSEMFVFKK